ncbi:EAL domain-containing protein [Alcaligenaceae bacterium]|nr:EAL domain-containing protein [Alcaligenaceae bacterium]
MSLLKQLLLSVTVAIGVIFIGASALSLDGARQYLDQQLSSQAENAASSLALSLSQPGNQDTAVRELLIMALYDSGQFESISMTDPGGAELFRASDARSDRHSAAPVWFHLLLPLQEPIATRAVSNGWRQLGVVSVAVDNSYAVDMLWQSSVRVLLLVLAAGVAWALFAMLLIRWLKRALHDEIASRVRAIPGDGTGGHAAGRVFAELAPVSRAINDTRQRVQANALEQHELIESLSVELNQDPITGLVNRKYFLSALTRAVQAANGADGHVLIFRQRDLPAINGILTRAGADQWLRQVSTRISELVNMVSGQRPLFARLNGSDFVVLLAGFSGPQAGRFVQLVQQALHALRVELGTGRRCRWALALTEYSSESEPRMVLARLDFGLMRAESAGDGNVEVVAPHTDAVVPSGAGESEWREIITTAMAENRMFLATRPVSYEGDTQIRRVEASLSLLDGQGQEISGQLFIPAAIRLNLSAACDLRSIELGLAWLANNDGELALRVSLASALQSTFVANLVQLLRDSGLEPRVLGRLLVEINAFGLVANTAEVQYFCNRMAQAQVRVGFRRLAQHPLALAQLHNVEAAYAKLGSCSLDNLPAGPGSLHLLAAVLATAQALHIKVYADEVGSPDALALLREQGAYIAAPIE